MKCRGKHVSIFDIFVKVSSLWNRLALDGSNWQTVDFFHYQKDVQTKTVENLSKRFILTFFIKKPWFNLHFQMWWLSTQPFIARLPKYKWFYYRRIFEKLSEYSHAWFIRLPINNRKGPNKLGETFVQT